MTEESETSAAASTAANKGVKRGLPLDGLSGAAQSATALWEVARLGLAPNQAFAKKLGRKSASGGGWSRLVAVLRGFGLVHTEGAQIGLSSLGQELVNGSDPAQQVAARRTALLHLKAYRDLVQGFDGTVLPDLATLASRLKFEYGKKDDFAEKAAQAFLDSLAFAEMVDAGGIVRKNGADAAVDPGPDQGDEDDQADLIDDAFESDDDDDDEFVADNAGEGIDDVFLGGNVRGSAQVNISVSLDLSKYRADEVIQILNVLNG